MQQQNNYYRLIKIFFQDAKQPHKLAAWGKAFTKRSLKISDIFCNEPPDSLNSCPLNKILYFYTS